MGNVSRNVNSGQARILPQDSSSDKSNVFTPELFYGKIKKKWSWRRKKKRNKGTFIKKKKGIVANASKCIKVNYDKSLKHVQVYILGT